jgi:hypothetical protein
MTMRKVLNLFGGRRRARMERASPVLGSVPASPRLALGVGAPVCWRYPCDR